MSYKLWLLVVNFYGSDTVRVFSECESQTGAADPICWQEPCVVKTSETAERSGFYLWRCTNWDEQSAAEEFRDASERSTPATKGHITPWSLSEATIRPLSFSSTTNCTSCSVVQSHLHKGRRLRTGRCAPAPGYALSLGTQLWHNCSWLQSYSKKQSAACSQG